VRALTAIEKERPRVKAGLGITCKFPSIPLGRNRGGKKSAEGGQERGRRRNGKSAFQRWFAERGGLLIYVSCSPLSNQPEE